MQSEIIGYLLNALEEDEVRAVEELLAESDAVRQQVELLRLALLPLGSDNRHEEPPRGLGVRTCMLVRESRRTRATDE